MGSPSAHRARTLRRRAPPSMRPTRHRGNAATGRLGLGLAPGGERGSRGSASEQEGESHPGQIGRRAGGGGPIRRPGAFADHYRARQRRAQGPWSPGEHQLAIRLRFGGERTTESRKDVCRRESIGVVCAEDPTADVVHTPVEMSGTGKLALGAEGLSEVVGTAAGYRDAHRRASRGWRRKRAARAGGHRRGLRGRKGSRPDNRQP